MGAFSYLTIMAAVVGAALGQADRSCEGITPKSRMQFCCGGIIYYDPNFLYSCQGGRVVRMNRAGGVVAPSATTPRMPIWNFFTNVPVPAQTAGYVLMPKPSAAPAPVYRRPAPQPPAPVVYCNGVNLSELQRVQPNLRCCANSAIYDTTKYYCGPGTRPQPIPAPTPRPLPTSFKPSTCQGHVFYIDPRIYADYECCGREIYNKETEFCQQAYRLVYQPTSSYRVQPINPGSTSTQNKLDCGQTTYIFANAEMAHRYQC